MKLQVKTVDRHTFRVNISEFKTVGKLKNSICKLRGPWIRPEAQQLLYAGQVLDDEERLRTYCIDERKFLVMITRPIPKRLKKCSSTDQSTIEDKENEKYSVAQSPSLSKRIIMQLGNWTEKEVRQALLISLNNSRRAIEYLTDKIEFFPNMVTPPTSNLFISIRNREEERVIDENQKEKEEVDSIEDFQSEQDEIYSVGGDDNDDQTQEEIRIINEYTRNDDEDFHQDSSDDKDESKLEFESEYEAEEINLLDDNRKKSESVSTIWEEGARNWKKINVTEYLETMKRTKPLNDVNDLIDMGFSRELAVKAFATCDGDAEAATNLLLEELEFREN